MSHKLSTMCLIVACFLGTSTSLWSQNADTVHGIPGYLDPKTGAFHPTPTTAAIDLTDPAAAATLTTFAGKIVVNFTITVSSVVTSTNKIGCTVSATLIDLGSGNTILEEASNAVTRGTGTTVACSVSIPYSWKLATAATDTIGLQWSIQSPVAISTPAAAYPNRLSSQSLGSIKVPSSGTTTTIPVAATI